MKKQKWIDGPELPLGISWASCVALPPTSNFACVLVGGKTDEEGFLSSVYGLNRLTKEWKLMGNIKTGVRWHIALPLS